MTAQPALAGCFAGTREGIQTIINSRNLFGLFQNSYESLAMGPLDEVARRPVPKRSRDRCPTAPEGSELLGGDQAPPQHVARLAVHVLRLLPVVFLPKAVDTLRVRDQLIDLLQEVLDRLRHDHGLPAEEEVEGTRVREDLASVRSLEYADGRPRAPIETDGLLQDHLPCALPGPLGDDLAVDDQLEALQLALRPGPSAKPELLSRSDVDPVTRPAPSIHFEVQDWPVRREAPPQLQGVHEAGVVERVLPEPDVDAVVADRGRLDPLAEPAVNGSWIPEFRMR
jgi:hypothetical protein